MSNTGTIRRETVANINTEHAQTEEMFSPKLNAQSGQKTKVIQPKEAQRSTATNTTAKQRANTC